MKRWFLILVAALLLGPSLGRAEIVLAERALHHEGRTITVEGVVAEVKVSGKNNVFLNFDAKYPDNRFVAAVLMHRGGAPLIREGVGWLKALRGKRVRVTGKIVLYQGRAQIHLSDRAQIMDAEKS